MAPEQHEQHDKLPDQRRRWQRLDEIQQSVDETRPPDKSEMPKNIQVNGTAELSPGSQSTCKNYIACYGMWCCVDGLSPFTICFCINSMSYYELAALHGFMKSFIRLDGISSSI